jgi:DNA-binding NarL/FixJ family response regulator
MLLLVADPDPILLQSLSAALLYRGAGGVLRVAAVEGVDEVMAEGIVGDLALVGLGFGSAAFRLIAELRAAGWPRVITLAPTIDPGPVLDAVQAGATGVLRRPPGIPVRRMDPFPALSAREVEILRLVADGRSNSWIGAQLSLSPLTVKNHLARLARKLGCGAREQLVAAALRGGIIE